METYENEAGTDELEERAPVERVVGVLAEHHLHVLEEAVDAVDPADDGHLDQADNERREAGAVIVHQLQDVHAALNEKYGKKII